MNCKKIILIILIILNQKINKRNQGIIKNVNEIKTNHQMERFLLKKKVKNLVQSQVKNRVMIMTMEMKKMMKNMKIFVMMNKKFRMMKMLK